MGKNYDTLFTDALVSQHKVFFENNTLKVDYSYVSNRCPVCESEKRKLYCIKDGFIHYRCKKCCAVYIDPRLNDEATLQFYNSEVNEIYNEQKFYNPIDSRDDAINKNNFKIIDTYIGGKKNYKLLEIGYGKGSFLKIAKENGYDIYGLELNQNLYEMTKSLSPNLYNKNLFDIKYDDNLFDIIYFRDVIEHIAQPKSFIQEISRIIKVGGLVVIDTHNINSIVNSLTRKYHTVIFGFEHPVHWNVKSLSILCNKYNLKLEKVFYNHKCQSLKNVLNYYLYPSFTYIHKPHQSSMKILFFRIINKLLSYKYLSYIDKKIFYYLSVFCGKGATMKVMMRKM